MLGLAAATVFVKAINTAANPDDVSSTIQYVEQKKAFLVNINGFEFNWFMLVAVIAVVLTLCKVPALAFALGMFIPMELNVPLVIGGVLNLLFHLLVK